MTDAHPHRAIYRRWRAQRFAEIVGQEPIVTALRNAVRGDRLHHALLFVGPRGTGKTSMARIVAKAINCAGPVDGEPDDTCAACVAIRDGRALDVVELDAASNNKVDDMRGLLERTWTAPSDLRAKVFIIDEVQRIREGWDVLLKTLEEPPSNVVFIFCTTDPSQIRPAVVSRVQRYDFQRLTVAQIEGKLTMILAAEGRAAEAEAITLIARLAAGGMRDAESMLDQLLVVGDDPIRAATVREVLGLADDEAVDGFIVAFVGGDALAAMAVLDDLESRGRDLRTFLDQVVDAIRADLIEELAGAAPSSDPVRLREAARRLAAIDATRQGPGGLRFALEVAVFEMADAPTREVRPSQTPSIASARPTTASPVAAPPVAASVEFDAPSSPPVPATTGVEMDGDASTGDGASTPINEPEDVPTAVGESPIGATTDDDLAALMAQWPAIVAHVSRHPPTRPLISVCRPIAVDGSVVTLGFPEGMAFLADVAERRRANLEDGIAQFLGHRVAVRCVATNLDVAALDPTADDSERLLAEARRIFADDLVEVAEVE